MTQQEQLNQDVTRMRGDITGLTDSLVAAKGSLDSISAKLTAQTAALTAQAAAIDNLTKEIADLKAANPAIDLSAFETGLGDIDKLNANATALATEAAGLAGA